MVPEFDTPVGGGGQHAVVDVIVHVTRLDLHLVHASQVAAHPLQYFGFRGPAVSFGFPVADRDAVEQRCDCE